MSTRSSWHKKWRAETSLRRSHELEEEEEGAAARPRRDDQVSNAAESWRVPENWRPMHAPLAAHASHSRDRNAVAPSRLPARMQRIITCETLVVAIMDAAVASMLPGQALSARV
jgi:hypothetical protein